MLQPLAVYKLLSPFDFVLVLGVWNLHRRLARGLCMQVRQMQLDEFARARVPDMPTVACGVCHSFTSFHFW